MQRMTTSGRVEKPADLRLMPFGRTEARHVRDGLWEPLWAGRRALVEVVGGSVGIRDEHDTALDGFEILRQAILECALAEELVLDGYLMPAPLRSTAGAEAPPGMDALMTPAQVGRQMLLGGGGNDERKEQLRVERARRAPLPPASPTAFVAVDLLWLDGESLLDVPLQERRRLLESALADHEIVRRTVAVRAPVEPWFAQWRALGFREMAVKASNSRYTPGRPNGEWAIALIPKR